jgi:hypothetical protein
MSGQSERKANFTTICKRNEYTKFEFEERECGLARNNVQLRPLVDRQTIMWNIKPSGLVDKGPAPCIFRALHPAKQTALFLSERAEEFVKLKT